MPKIKWFDPIPSYWTPWRVWAALPDVPILLDAVTRHQSVVVNGVLRRDSDSKYGWVYPIEFGLIFKFSWKTISRALNNNKPLIIRKRTPLLIPRRFNAIQMS